MKFENTEVWGFESAIKLLRATDDMEKSDSGWKGFCTESNDWVDESCSYDACLSCCEKIREFFIGENDLKIMQNMILAENHHHFMKQIHVLVDVTTTVYWWKKFEKIGTMTKNKTIQDLKNHPITKDCFEMTDFIGATEHESLPYSFFDDYWDNLIKQLERIRKIYIETNDNLYLKELVRLLPQSWLETRTIAMTYDDVLLMIRNNEPLITKWAKSLPYSEELLFI